MKQLCIFFIMLFSVCAYGMEFRLIISDDEPNEIYLVGVHPYYRGFMVGFYYSSDCGETIELRDSVSYEDEDYGTLLPDAANNTLYRQYRNDTLTYIEHLYLSTNGGYSWTLVNNTLTGTYASGMTTGEIYRRSAGHTHTIERSTNYGYDYFPCATIGGPDSLGIRAVAIGVDSGEVYIWGDHGKLYLSDDFGENFTFLGDLTNNWDVDPRADMYNGASEGEVYLFLGDPKIIWRVTNYGTNVEMIADFPPMYDFWYGAFTSTTEPGELYFLAVIPDWFPGGTMHIYHTINYFQDWIMYEHVVDWANVDMTNPSEIPSSLLLNIWPNPANASFDISYQLPSVQQVNFKLYNTLGQQVWRHEASIQSPGCHLWHYRNEQLPSGTYFLQLQTESMQEIRKLSIIK